MTDAASTDSRQTAGEGPAADDGLRLQVMGPLRIWRGAIELDAGPRQQRALLGLLLAQHDRPVAMGDLIDLLWEVEPPVTAVNIIQKYVGALRRILEPGLQARSSGSYLRRQGTGYCLTAGPEVLDLAAFRRLAVYAKESAGRERPDDALDHYLEALRLCRGTTGDGLADSAAATATFAGIDGEFFDAAVAAAEVAVQAGRPREVLKPLRLAARMDRLNEPVYACLVSVLAAAGYQAEALEVYRSIRERLTEELGIDPGSDLREAHQRVLTQTVTPRAEVTPTDVEEVRSTRADLTASWAGPVRPAQLPPDHSLFVGRGTELTLLGRLVNGMSADGRTGPLVIAVDGMGGVGKSTLAAHFAHQIVGEFPDGQLYLDLQGHESDVESVPVVEALRSLLYALGLRGADAPESLDALVGAYRSLTAGRRILVLLDNVRDPAQVRPLLPNSAGSLVLVTSRFPQVGLAVSEGARLIRLDLPDRPMAREMLDRRLAQITHRRINGDDAEAIDAIIELCGRLPLALAILAARLSARPQLSLVSVVTELRDGARRLEAFPGGRGVVNPRSAFSWSYRQLSPEAARLFRLLSAALTPGITAEACASMSGRDLRRTRESLEELEEAALVSESDHGRFSSHVLVKAYAEELFLATEPPAERREVVTRLLQHYLHSSSHAQLLLTPTFKIPPPPQPLPGVVAERPVSSPEAFDWFARHHDVLFEAVRTAADLGYGIIPWQLALTMPSYLETSGFFRDWEDITRLALSDARARADVIGEAHVVRSLAGARWFVGAPEHSLELLQTALRLYTEHEMPTEQTAVHVNLYAVHTSLGRDDLALKSSHDAILLSRLTGDRLAEIACLICGGRSLTRLGRHDESAEMLQQAFDICGVIENWSDEPYVRLAMAQNLVGMGRADEAVEQFTLADRAADNLSNGPIRLEAYQSLSELLISVGDPTGAQQALDKATEVLESFQDGGPDHMRFGLQQLAKKLSRLDQPTQ